MLDDGHQMSGFGMGETDGDAHYGLASSGGEESGSKLPRQPK